MSGMAQITGVSSQWVGWLKSLVFQLFAQPFVQAQIKENIKAPRQWPLWRESTSDWWFSSQMASNAENVSGFYTKGRQLVKPNLICPSDKLSWQPSCPVLNINIQGNFCISQGNGSSDKLPENLGRHLWFHLMVSSCYLITVKKWSVSCHIDLSYIKRL